MAASQTPTPSGVPDPDLVTPGTLGFLVTLVIVIAAIFLIRDALKRVRRVRARSQASDAYPIPMRKYAVPNQSTLSGATAPVDEAAESEESGAAEDVEEPLDSSSSADSEGSRESSDSEPSDHSPADVSDSQRPNE